MPDQQPPIDTSPADPAADEPRSAIYASEAEDEQWLEESEQELPRRPRRRLLTPLPLALLAVLLLACGFIGGVLVEKGEGSSGSSTGSAGSLASRFAALSRGGSGALTGGAASGGAGGGSGASSIPGFNRPTTGTVAYLAGNTIYVTNSEGNTVKVTTSAATSVTKTVKSTVKGIHPGETVTVEGATGAKGAVSAESISVGSSGGGLAALFGRGGAGGGGSGAGGAGGGSSGAGQALFGNGG